MFKSKKFRRLKRVFLPLQCLIFVTLASQSVYAEELSPEISNAVEKLETQVVDEMTRPQQPQAEPSPDAIKTLEQKAREQNSSRKTSGNVSSPDADTLQSVKQLDEKQRRFLSSKERTEFKNNELRLDLPDDTVLASSNGETLVDVAEFNQRVKSSRGNNVYEARLAALDAIIKSKLIALHAIEEGYENDPYVQSKTQKAEQEIEAKRRSAQYVREISDEEARKYYEQNKEKFRKPDRGTRVLFSVEAARSQADSNLRRIKNGEPFDHFVFQQDPLPGSRLPQEVQDALFNLKPEEITEVVQTPIGFYIAKLMERNPFNRFKVSLLVRSELQEAKELTKRIKGGERFESFVATENHLSVDVKALPQEVQTAVQELHIGEVSQPIITPFGYFLVKLKERWSEAEILSAMLIRVDSQEKGEELLARLREGLAPEGEKEISGRDLPAELLEKARTLKQDEYGGPVQTSMGHYLIKVTERAIDRYLPFAEVKESIKKLMRGEQIPDSEAMKYYEGLKHEYRRPVPLYLVEVILAESSEEGGKIADELKKTLEEPQKGKLFARYQQDLKENISAERLPEQCQDEVRKLKPGEITPVLSTHLGYFIVRLNEIVDPSFVPFEEVKNEIKGALAETNIEEEVIETKRDVKIHLKTEREEALKTAFYRDFISRVDTISEEEAEKWWEENKKGFFAAMGMPVQENFVLVDKEKTLLFKKSNTLLQRFKGIVDNLYAESGVYIYENFLY